MSPSRDQPTEEFTDKKGFNELGLSIVGLGVEYPPFLLEPSALDTLVKRHYPDSPAYVDPRSPFSNAGTQLISAVWQKSS